MADWKQITARIRRARGSKDPAAQLLNLFQKTSDAMVAFELARHYETAGQSADAIEWYNKSLQRFRRADWKTKATDAIARLGGEVSAPSSASPAEDAPPVTVSEPDASFPQDAEVSETISESVPEDVSVAAAESPSGAAQPQRAAPDANRRRRGRRGGRNRRKGGASRQTSQSASSRQAPAASEPHEVQPPRIVDSRSIPSVPVEGSAEPLAAGLKGRFGDPGLSSRLSLLEMQFRRLLTCPPVKLDQADRGPAGPGVFVLTDDEMTSYYYVEACDTLRIAVSNLARSGTSRRGATPLKALLAEHLGIPESRVSKYLTDHCVVRWLQLDEGATHFAHFVISVLRPVLNE